MGILMTYPWPFKTKNNTLCWKTLQFFSGFEILSTKSVFVSLAPALGPYDSDIHYTSCDFQYTGDNFTETFATYEWVNGAKVCFTLCVSIGRQKVFTLLNKEEQYITV